MTTTDTDRRFTVAKAGANKWHVLDAGEPVDGFFKTKGLAQAEADASEHDAAAGIPETDDEAISRMRRGERLAVGLREGHAIADWRAAGQKEQRPATPVLDWYADPTTKPARAKSGERRTVRTVDQDVQLDRVVTDGRTAGMSWWKIAAALNEAGVPTATGKPWRDTTAWAQGKRLGLVAA